MQGGPHQNQIAALATQLKEVNEPDFREYIVMVKNAKAMANRLLELGYSVITGGTDNHIVLVSLRDKGLTGSKLEKVCELVSITINKNLVPGDTSALSPGGIRLGTPALTSRGFLEEDFIEISNLIDECVKIALKIQDLNGKKMVDFVRDIENNTELAELKKKWLIFQKSIPVYLINYYSNPNISLLSIIILSI